MLCELVTDLIAACELGSFWSHSQHSRFLLSPLSRSYHPSPAWKDTDQLNPAWDTEVLSCDCVTGYEANDQERMKANGPTKCASNHLILYLDKQ